MSIFKECPACGAHLDPGETCNCREPKLVTEAFLAIGTICTGIRECGPLEGAIFDDLLKKAVLDKTSPLWNLNSADQTKITFDPSLYKK